MYRYGFVFSVGKEVFHQREKKKRERERKNKIIPISFQAFPRQPGTPGVASLSLEVCIVRVFTYDLYIGMFLITEKYTRCFCFPSQKSVAVFLCSFREVYDIY